MSGCIPHLSSSHSPVFLLNSCLDLFSAPRRSEDPLSLSYGASLPSSLTVSLSTPQYALRDHLCRFAVRGPCGLSLAGFLGSMITLTVSRPRGGGRTVGSRLGRRASLAPSTPTTFNALIRQRAEVPLLRHRIAPQGRHGMLTVCPSASPLGLALGAGSPRDDRHCPGNLGLSAGRVLAALVVTHTYICLSARSSAGRPAHSQHAECSPTDTPPKKGRHVPRLRRLPYTRLLSTPGPSTSELLRTL